MDMVSGSSAFMAPQATQKMSVVQPQVSNGAVPQMQFGQESAASGGANVSTFAAVATVAALAAGVRSKRSARKGKKAAVVRCALNKNEITVPNEITEEHPLRVIVAGGGVGGLMAAKAFTTIGPKLSVTMFEQAKVFGKFGGPIQLASNALSTIREIDEDLFNNLMEKFTFTGNRRNGLVDGLRTEWYCPFEAMQTAADLFDLPYTGVVDRPDLQQCLLDTLPDGVLENGKKVAKYDILGDNQGVNVTCNDGTVTNCDVLIGADGIWSACRAQMWGEEQKGPKSGCTYSGYIVFAGETVYQPEDYFEVGYKVYMGPKRYFVCSDVGRGRIQWYAFCAVPEGEEIPESNADKKDYIEKAFFGWSQQVLDLVAATPAPTIEDRALYDRPPSFTKSWAEGPVALMGDAVHPMMPNLGQGGCQAMEDGYTLAQMLKEAKHRSEVPDILQAYYRERILRTAGVQFLSRIASDLLLDTFTFPWKSSEGLSAPYGKDKGDFSYNAVVVNYLRYILGPIFMGQFSWLYSYHPYKWTKDEVKELVEKCRVRHEKDAHEAWNKRMGAVEDGTQDDSGDGTVSFFAKVKTY